MMMVLVVAVEAFTWRENKSMKLLQVTAPLRMLFMIDLHLDITDAEIVFGTTEDETVVDDISIAGI